MKQQGGVYNNKDYFGYNVAGSMIIVIVVVGERAKRTRHSQM